MSDESCMVKVSDRDAVQMRSTGCGVDRSLKAHRSGGTHLLKREEGLPQTYRQALFLWYTLKHV